MSAGIDQLVAAIRPTVGPKPRVVAIDGLGPYRGRPELLDSGGLIARRILELPHRGADVGAMTLRHLLWQIYEEVGDGTGAAALIFQTIYQEGLRFIAAGGNSMMLRRHLEAGALLVEEHLESMSVPLATRQRLGAVIESVCYDPEMAELLIEMHELAGEEGLLDIRTGRGRKLEREYVEGSYWPTPGASQNVFADNYKAQFNNAFLLLSDFELDKPEAVYAFLKSIEQADGTRILFIARRFSKEVIAFLRRAHKTVEGYQVAGAQLPGKDQMERMAVLEDLAALSGGRPLVGAAGDALAQVRLSDLGRARRVWVDRDHFGLVRGQGDPHELRAHIARLRNARAHAADTTTRTGLQQRIGRLRGGSAILWVGAATETEATSRKALAERAALTVSTATQSGLVPGGGVAFLACQHILQQKGNEAHTLEERVAYQILHKAMEAPVRAIVENSGYRADAVLGQLCVPNTVFDALSGRIVESSEAGIQDVTAVLQTAARTAITGAALALTTDVIIHRREPEQSREP